MKYRLAVILIIVFSYFSKSYAQEADSLINKSVLDSLYILEVEDIPGQKPKILHAEPLYIDLIRDLGARKGEREWNFGGGLTDNLNYDTYEMLVEYEWAPIDRLGLEVEIPVTFYAENPNLAQDSVIYDKIESLKVAAQWSFLVSEKYATTLALGYINEFVLSDFGSFGSPLIKANMFNPFFIAAKRWGNNFHTLIYTGPQLEFEYKSKAWHSRYEWHSNFHYMIPGTRNFIGLEINKYFSHNDFDMTLRPQMRVGVSDNFLIGIVGGIPFNRENERLSSFIRLIWEPDHRKRLH